MRKHQDLGDRPFSRLRQLKSLIDNGEILLGGNAHLKIYGTLNCKSGRRLKVKNRVFFATEQEAIKMGYRPCGHCMRTKYRLWKAKKQFKLSN